MPQLLHVYLGRELEAPRLLVLLGALGAAEPRPAASASVQPMVAAHGTERPRRELRLGRLDSQGRGPTRVYAELVRLQREEGTKKML